MIGATRGRRRCAALLAGVLVLLIGGCSAGEPDPVVVTQTVTAGSGPVTVSDRLRMTGCPRA